MALTLGLPLQVPVRDAPDQQRETAYRPKEVVRCRVLQGHSDAFHEPPHRQHATGRTCGRSTDATLISLAPDFVQVLRGRIQALARAHEQGLGGGWCAVPFRDLVQKELGPYAQTEGRLVKDGPPLHRKPKAALDLA